MGQVYSRLRLDFGFLTFRLALGYDLNSLIRSVGRSQPRFPPHCLLHRAQSAVDGRLADARKTVSKRVLVSRWAGFAAYSRHRATVYRMSL